MEEISQMCVPHAYAGDWNVVVTRQWVDRRDLANKLAVT